MKQGSEFHFCLVVTEFSSNNAVAAVKGLNYLQNIALPVAYGSRAGKSRFSRAHSIASQGVKRLGSASSSALS